MIKEFFNNSFIYTIGIILTRGISIILLPIYTRYLSPLEYGILDLFIILTSIVTIVFSLEIHQAVVRFYQDTQNNIEKAEYVSTAFVFSIFVYSIFCLLSFFYSESLTLFLLDDIKQKNIFLLAVISIGTSGLFYFVSGQLKWQILPKQSVMVSILHIIFVASISVYLLVFEDMKVESIFIGQIVGNILGSILSIYYAKESYQFVFVFSKLKEMLSFSFPVVFSSIAVFLSLYIDRIAIQDLLGLEYLGIYGVAYKFAMIAGLVMVGFQSSLSPLIYKYYKEDSTPKSIERLFNGFSIFMLLIIVASIFFSKEVVILMTSEEFYNASTLITPLVIAVFFSRLYIFTPGLSIAKKTSIIAIVSFVSAIINTILNYFFIPIYGILGAALGTMVSSILIFFTHAYLSKIYYNVNYGFFKKVIYFSITLSIVYLINNLFDSITFISILIKLILLMIVSLLSVYILLDKSDTNQVFSFIFKG